MAREATRRMRRGERHPGLFRGTDLVRQIGRAIDDLELASKVYDPGDIADVIEWIPFR